MDIGGTTSGKDLKNLLREKVSRCRRAEEAEILERLGRAADRNATYEIIWRSNYSPVATRHEDHPLLSLRRDALACG
jgi:hypothetical protein